MLMTYDALLPPGEYTISLVSGQPSKERYKSRDRQCGAGCLGG
jgi:hypothetical protein